MPSTKPYGIPSTHPNSVPGAQPYSMTSAQPLRSDAVIFDPYDASLLMLTDLVLMYPPVLRDSGSIVFSSDPIMRDSDPTMRCSDPMMHVSDQNVHARIRPCVTRVQTCVVRILMCVIRIRSCMFRIQMCVCVGFSCESAHPRAWRVCACSNLSVRKSEHLAQAMGFIEDLSELSRRSTRDITSQQ